MGDFVMESRDDIPAGLPAVWVTDQRGTTLYVRPDLPEPLRRHFRDMCAGVSAA